MTLVRPSREGMTLIEIMVVIVIIALGTAGLGFSVNALTRANLKSGAAKFAAAARYAFNRAASRGSTVRIAFDIPGNAFSIEEAYGRITLTRGSPFRQVRNGKAENQDEENSGAVDPWAVAKAELEKPLEPTLGASPFGPIQSEAGEPVKRFTQVDLGRHVHVVRLIVPHEPEPKEAGKGAVHFFPSGYTEHAVIHLSDGAEGVYSVEVSPLTGRCKIRAEAYEPEELIDNPDDPGISEVEL